MKTNYPDQTYLIFSSLFVLLLFLYVPNSLKSQIQERFLLKSITQHVEGIFEFDGKGFSFSSNQSTNGIPNPTSIQINPNIQLIGNDLNLKFTLPKLLRKAQYELDLKLVIGQDTLYSQQEYLRKDFLIRNTDRKANNEILWADLLESKLVGTNQVRIILEANIWDDQDFDCLKSPKFHWLHGPLVTAIGGLSWGIGHIYGNRSDDLYNQYLDAVIQERSTTEVEEIFNKANNKNDVNYYGASIGKLFVALGLVLTARDLISLPRRKKRFCFYCADCGESTKGITLQPILDIPQPNQSSLVGFSLTASIH